MAPTVLAFNVEPSKRRFRLRLARYQALAEVLADFVDCSTQSGRDRVDLLDVGVGNGRSHRYAEPLGVTDRIRFHGIELDPRRLADVHGGSRWRLKQGDVEKGLPYGDECFDVVVCEQVLEHLKAPGRAVAEMTRVLRPGGLLVAGVPIFPPGAVQIRRHVVPPLQRLLGIASDHLQAFSLSSFRSLIRQGGALELVWIRGFRLFSGGMISTLENHRWWYDLNRFVGRHVPSLCVEAQIVARKPAAAWTRARAA